MQVLPLIAPQQLKNARSNAIAPATIKSIGNDDKESPEIDKDLKNIKMLLVRLIAIIYQGFQYNRFGCTQMIQSQSVQCQLTK